MKGIRINIIIEGPVGGKKSTVSNIIKKALLKELRGTEIIINQQREGHFDYDIIPYRINLIERTVPCIRVT